MLGVERSAFEPPGLTPPLVSAAVRLPAVVPARRSRRSRRVLQPGDRRRPFSSFVLLKPERESNRRPSCSGAAHWKRRRGSSAAAWSRSSADCGARRQHAEQQVEVSSRPSHANIHSSKRKNIHRRVPTYVRLLQVLECSAHSGHHG